MIVNYFKRTKPINIILLSIVLIILIIFSFFSYRTLVFSTLIVSHISLLIISFLLFNVISKEKLVSFENDLGRFLYVLISAILYFSFFDINLIISNFLLLFAYKELFTLSDKEVNEPKKLFNYGFIIGITSYFYTPIFLFLLISVVAVFVFNKISWRTLSIPFIGFITPLLFAFVLNDLFDISFVTTYLPKFSWYLNYNQITLLSQVTMVFFGLLILMSFSIISKNLNMDLKHYKSFHILIIVHLIISIFLLVFSPTKEFSETIFFIFPISILLANAIPLIQKKWLSNIIVYLLIIILILQFITKS